MSKRFLSIDIGGTFIKHVYIDENFEITDKQKVPTPKTKEEFLQIIDDILEQRTDFSGVSICAPGRISEEGTIYFGGALSFLHETPLAKLVTEKCGKPCTVINDAKAAVLAEHSIGNLKGVKNGVAITLGTGVGGGIIINDQLLMGSSEQAGEFSFILTKVPSKNEFRHSIGAIGSSVGFISRCAEVLNLEDKKDGYLVFESLNKGDNSQVNKIFEEYCDEIALLIYNIHSIINFEKVVIGGGVSRQDIMIDGIRKSYDKIIDNLGFIKSMLYPITIDRCAFSNDANLYGALTYFKSKND